MKKGAKVKGPNLQGVRAHKWAVQNGTAVVKNGRIDISFSEVGGGTESAEKMWNFFGKIRFV